MKKKAIEKIPYLGLKKTSGKKAVKYIGVTAVKIVGHERHLFLEIYRNKKRSKDIPVVRIVTTKKDFGIYYPEKDTWTREKIEVDGGWGGLIWQQAGDAYGWQQIEKESILQSTEDLERLKSFCKGNVWNENRWWEYIYNLQDDIVKTARRKTEQRKYERSQQALADREAHTRELPEKEILKMAEDVYFDNKHYLFYKKRGCWVQIACSKCGGVTDARWKDGLSYESQFQRYVEEPREGKTGTCPMCGEWGEYKCQGKMKNGLRKSTHLFLGQKYKDAGMVMRYVEVEKEWVMELICTDKGEEMHGAYEKIAGVEIARVYFEPGKKIQKDYHKYDPYTGRDYWDDCNMYGLQNIIISEAPIMPKTYEEMQGTMFQYSALKEYARGNWRINPVDYLERYIETPQIEMLVKMGLIGVVKQLVKCRYGIVTARNARRPDEFLGIRKERVKQLIRKQGDIELLETMQMEKRQNQRWTDEQVENLTETGLRGDQVKLALKYMTMQKLLNRIKRYAGCEYGSDRSGARAQIRHTATTYADYLYMRESLGYDLNNTVYQQPRNLDTEHTKMVMQADKEKEDKHLREVAEKYPNIRYNYKKLRKKYFYEDDRYIIRPARSAEEIAMEGRILHHCVGSAGYLNKHDMGQTYILMLRFKDEPDIPYITVEVDTKIERMVQWYGDKDSKPDQKNIQRWLNMWLRKLQTGTLTEQIQTVAIA